MAAMVATVSNACISFHSAVAICPAANGRSSSCQYRAAEVGKTPGLFQLGGLRKDCYLSERDLFGGYSQTISERHMCNKAHSLTSRANTSAVASAKLSPTLATRRLILLRHAKSSWADPSLKDHYRPLSKRGREGAVSIANKLKELGWIPSLILCSDSVRTRQTLELMGEAVKAFKEAEVVLLGSYYSIAAMDGQTAKHLHDTVLEHSNDSQTTVMCMGHNRGWEEAASELSGRIIELKTANAALLECKKPEADWGSAFAAGWKLKSVEKPDAQSA